MRLFVLSSGTAFIQYWITYLYSSSHLHPASNSTDVDVDSSVAFRVTVLERIRIAAAAVPTGLEPSIDNLLRLP